MTKKDILNDIEKLKRRLIEKARTKGLYENFGQKEAFKLKKKYPTGYMGEERFNMDEIWKFEKWAMNVGDNDIR